MTNNTIPNVPRELLERVIMSTHMYWPDAPLIKELRAILSAPSPAGVDGLEVVQAVAWLNTATKEATTHPVVVMDWDDEKEPVESLMPISQHEAIIDGLRREVARYRAVLDGAKYPNLDKLLSFSVEDCRFLGETVASMTISVQSERDQQAQRIGELKGLLRDSAELIKHGVFEDGYCCCGSSVDSHGLGDGHSPVDALAYHAGQVCERIDAALSSGKDSDQ